MGLDFVALTKANEFRRQVIPGDAVADLLWNDTSVASFVLDDDHPAVAELTAPGARCRVRLDEVDLFRGRVAKTPGNGPNGQIEFHVECDKRKMYDWLGWPKPTAAITAQDVEYARYTGSTEAVVRAAVVANLTRLGVPWTFAPNTLNRGPAARVEFRFHELGDRLYPLLRAARLGLILSYDEDDDVTVSLRSPNTVAGTLDPTTGILNQFEFDRFAPSSTRVVVGGRGDGTGRDLHLEIDSARETEWGDIIEVFKDARMVEAGDDLSIDADEALAEGAPGMSVSMDLIETDAFRFGEHYDLGDLVPVRTGSEDPVTEVITQITISDTAADGVVVTPHIGAIAVDPNAQLAERINALKARVRDMGRR